MTNVDGTSILSTHLTLTPFTSPRLHPHLVDRYRPCQRSLIAACSRDNEDGARQQSALLPSCDQRRWVDVVEASTIPPARCASVSPLPARLARDHEWCTEVRSARGKAIARAKDQKQGSTTPRRRKSIALFPPKVQLVESPAPLRPLNDDKAPSPCSERRMINREKMEKECSCKSDLVLARQLGAKPTPSESRSRHSCDDGEGPIHWDRSRAWHLQLNERSKIGRRYEERLEKRIFARCPDVSVDRTSPTTRLRDRSVRPDSLIDAQGFMCWIGFCDQNSSTFPAGRARTDSTPTTIRISRRLPGRPSDERPEFCSVS